ncbi:ATP-binding protein [Stackebrandtia nassauensis]|nr:ATP-binding protein [Stackebrandtia nassauensis]
MWNAVLPPLVITLAAAGAFWYLLSAPAPVTTSTRVLVLCVAGVIALIAILWSVARASSVSFEAHGDLTEIRAMIPRGPEDLQAAVERWQRGERPHLPDPPSHDAGELPLLAYELDRFRTEAVDAVVRATTTSAVNGAPPGGVDVRVGVFVNLARRLQSLVHREIQLLDDLEAQVEDPDLLKGLFAVDHLATRIRRHAENLAVLGGAVSSRQWSKPVNMYVVLRSAVAEVEQYARVKLVRPIEGTLKGHAVADVIHLVAELVENATSFSNPNTQVLLRAQRVTAGIALEVEDRGLGMPREDQHRLNSMLSSPDQVDVAELLNDGRIGLFVVSTLARRHGVAVQLQTNIYGGIQAVIVLPHDMLGDAGQPKLEQQPAQQPQPEPPAQLEQRQVSAPPMPPRIPEEVPSAPAAAPAPAAPTAPSPAPAPTPASTPPVAPTSPAPVPSLSTEPPRPTRRPLPYAGRNTGAGGAASVSPDPRPTSERPPSPAMTSATEPVSPAALAESPVRQRPPSSLDDPSAGSGFVSVGGPPRLFEPGNPNETTGVIHMGPIPPEEESTPDSAGAAPDADRKPDDRPRLPQRRRQTHLVPELREVAAPRNEQLSEHDPGLMMAFQKGVNRAAPEAEDADGRFDGAS